MISMWRKFFNFHFFLCDDARKNMCDRHRPPVNTDGNEPSLSIFLRFFGENLFGEYFFSENFLCENFYARIFLASTFWWNFFQKKFSPYKKFSQKSSC